jgi:hypothetical protein
MSQLTEDKKRVKDLVAAFNTPIVFHPGGWEDTLPEWLKLRVIAERVAMVCNGGWNKATDAEVTCYLYTAALNSPLTSDWTEITLYEAAKQIPQLQEAVPHTPKELSDYQKHELDGLKRDIRNSQLRRQNTKRKEGTMPKRKLVIDEKEGSVMMGVMKEGTDPVIKTVEGDLESALAGIPGLLKEAEEKWAVSPKNPAYKPEPKPKAETKPAAQAPKATEDLPLLAEQPPAAAEKPAETEGQKPEETAQPAAPAPEEQAQEPAAGDLAPAAEPQTEAPAEEMATEPTPAESGTVEPEPATEAEPTPAESGTPEPEPATEAEPTPAESGTPEPVKVPEQWPPERTEPEKPEPEGMVPIGESEPTPEETAEDVAAMEKDLVESGHSLEPAAAEPAPAPQPAATTAAPSGQWQYRLKDGRGPFDTVQAAMDEMGLDQATRPQHNRWDRLSTSLKDSIRREPKAS